TVRGGMTSHAAVVARGMGKCCVSGCGAIKMDEENKKFELDGKTYVEGDWISIDGSTGNIYDGAVPTVDATIAGKVYKEGDYLSLDGTGGYVYAGKMPTAPSEVIQVLIRKTLKPEESHTYRDFARVMEWCSRATKLGVRTNADSPDQVEAAIAFGAQGIGLCRTEHMFFGGNRIDFMRRMILATHEEDSREAVANLLPFQKSDFKGIFKALAGKPGTIRLLDPPLHEFLPTTKEQQLDLAKKFNIPVEVIIRRVGELHEFNPMLGHRGCRLGIAHPEITEMQARAIIEAAIEVQEETGCDVRPEIMVPLVSFKRELDLQKEVIDKVAEQVFREKGRRISYKVGTMIEIPRACVTADEIAETAEFFSFGTNDLTQTGLGMSRDDSGSFLPNYRNLEIVKANVFASIDQEGVGKLMKLAADLGRSTRPNIKLGICGEHGGDPASVKFCHKLGLDYVSCSPYRVPTARLAAAQAALADM
ncbi:MAG: pyruvate, phosphate dikinase, partial [Akkermansia sp.]|nr:pyruvate, phosphate dikinase [Akkermansia sp.]